MWRGGLSARAGAAGILLIHFAACFVWAEPGDLKGIIANPNPPPGGFGASLGVMGDDILVGSPLSDKVYLFDGQTGLPLLTIPRPTSGDPAHFGGSVAAAGRNVIIGAPGDSTDGRHVGVAYLYDGQTGQLLQTFRNPNQGREDHFGKTVCAVGNNVLVGTDWADIGGRTDCGAAYLFDGQTGQLLHTFLIPVSQSGFGLSLAATGNAIFVGAFQESIGSHPVCGAVYVFDGSTYDLTRKIVPEADGQFLGSWFGYSLATMGGNLIVGAPLNNRLANTAGAAFLIDPATGSLLQSFYSPDPQENERFGELVCAAGDNVLVGTPYHNVVGGEDGAAYLLDGRTGATLLTLLDPNPVSGTDEGFATAIAALGNDILVSDIWEDLPATDAGAVFRFEGIPEPATLVLLGALPLVRRRRR